MIASSVIVETLLKVAEKNGGKLLGIAADKMTRLRDAITVNFSGYFESTVEHCSHVISLFDRSKPIDLFSLYVKVYLEHAKSKIGDKQLRDAVATLSVEDSVRIFLITGSAGTGKTFLMRWLFLTLLETADSRIPFYVELRGINQQNDTDLVSFLFGSLVARHARLTLETFRSGMSEGEYIFILDGLDEVEPGRRSILSRQIIELQTKYRGVIFIISTRPDEGLAAWVMARKYTVLPLDKRATIALIRKIPYAQSVKRKFIREVDLSLYDRHRSFLSNPLLINVMLLTYGDSADVPAKMYLFYEQAYETLFYRHDSWKETGFQRKHFCPILIDEFKRVLSAFCISSYKRSRFTFTMSDALELIKEAAEFERVDLNPEDFLRDAVESLCILQLDGLNYTFTHRSFQEFFAAVFISRGPPIALGNLLDALASRRGDVVLSMAMDMNHSLIEREWILPRLESITSRDAIDNRQALGFAMTICGEIFFDWFKGQFSLEAKSDSRNRVILSALSDLFPDDIRIPDDLFDFSEEDLKRIEALSVSKFCSWWHDNQSLRRRMVENLQDYLVIEAKLEKIRGEKTCRELKFWKVAKQLDVLEDQSNNAMKRDDLFSQRALLELEKKEIKSQVDVLETVITAESRHLEEKGRSWHSIVYDKLDASRVKQGPLMTGNFLLMYLDRFRRRAKTDDPKEIDPKEIDSLVYEDTVQLCRQETAKSMRRRWRLKTDDDSEWFSTIAAAERLVRLASSLTNLYNGVNFSIDQSRRIGTKLLD
jgi:NACHT domain